MTSKLDKMPVPPKRLVKVPEVEKRFVVVDWVPVADPKRRFVIEPLVEVRLVEKKFVVVAALPVALVKVKF